MDKTNFYFFKHTFKTWTREGSLSQCRWIFFYVHLAEGPLKKDLDLRYGSKGALIEVVWEHDFCHTVAERASVYVDSGSVVLVLVRHDIFAGAPPKLEEAAGHLGQGRLKFVQIKLWQVDVLVEEDPVRLPEQSCRSSFRNTNFKFHLFKFHLGDLIFWAQPLLSFQARPAVRIRGVAVVGGLLEFSRTTLVGDLTDVPWPDRLDLDLDFFDLFFGLVEGLRVGVLFLSGVRLELFERVLDLDLFLDFSPLIGDFDLLELLELDLDLVLEDFDLLEPGDLDLVALL